MAELKTQRTDASVEEFLNTISEEGKRKESFVILDLMRQVTGVEPRMWGSSIVGFGDLRYSYASGRQGDWFKVGFSPRKQNLTLYLLFGGVEAGDLLQKLGKHKTGKGCLYINKLADVDMTVLKDLVNRAYVHNSAHYTAAAPQ